jgi:hypothetical protein
MHEIGLSVEQQNLLFDSIWVMAGIAAQQNTCMQACETTNHHRRAFEPSLSCANPEMKFHI